MAELPVPRRAGRQRVLRDGSLLSIDLPEAPRAALRTLVDAGFDAVLVGGCVRDAVLSEPIDDWDLASDASPDLVRDLFAGSVWENRFGTVTLPGAPRVEVTTYRAEAQYTDRRRPATVRFIGSLGDDLARRDFTINAMAWRPIDLDGGAGMLVDPHGGLDDLRARCVRAVGNARDRFAEDALRLLRAVRFGVRLGFTLAPETERAVVDAAASASTLSGERVRDELHRLLDDPRVTPSVALRQWEELGLLAVLLPELAALRGVPQGKRLPGDALDHSLRTADALPTGDPVLRLAGLLHDVGKATTMDGGRFVGHERVGAQQADAAMDRLRHSRADIERVRALIAEHMFGYDDSWTDAAVRRLVARVGPHLVDDLLALRDADDAASTGADPAAQRGTRALRARIAAQRDAPIAQRQLAIDGHDLQRELRLEPGPQIGRLLDELLDAVVEDPNLNRREALLALARRASEDRPGG